MFDPRAFLTRYGKQPTVSVKAHGWSLKLDGRPEEPTTESIVDLAKAQVEMVKLSGPKIEDGDRTFREKDQLQGEHAGYFIAGELPPETEGKSKRRKEVAEALEAANGQK